MKYSNESGWTAAASAGPKSVGAGTYIYQKAAHPMAVHTSRRLPSSRIYYFE